MDMKRITLNGKVLLLPQIVTVQTFQRGTFRETIEQKLQQRNLILKHFSDDETPNPVRAEARRVNLCPRSREARKMTARGYPCQSPLCPFCAEVTAVTRSERYARSMQAIGGRLRNTGMLTLKMPATPFDRCLSDRHSLSRAIEQVRSCFRRFWTVINQRTRLFRAGVYAIHVHWDFASRTWDVHIHAVFIGNPDAEEIAKLRRFWGNLSGRRDAKALHWSRLRYPIGTAIRYITPGLVSTFVDRLGRSLDHSRTNVAYRRAAAEPEVLSEYLFAIRPIGARGKKSRRMMASLGKLRGSSE